MSNFYLGNICIYTIPLFLEKNSCLLLFSIGNVEPTKFMSSLKCLSNLRFLLNFTLALWIERRMRAVHFWQSYEAYYNPLLLYSRIMCTLIGLETLTWKHILQHPLWPGNTDHVPFYTTVKHQQIRPWKGSVQVYPLITFSVLFTLAQSHIVLEYSPPCLYFQWFTTTEEFAIFDVKIMVHKIR